MPEDHTFSVREKLSPCFVNSDIIAALVEKAGRSSLTRIPHLRLPSAMHCPTQPVANGFAEGMWFTAERSFTGWTGLYSKDHVRIRYYDNSLNMYSLIKSLQRGFFVAQSIGMTGLNASGRIMSENSSILFLSHSM